MVIESAMFGQLEVAEQFVFEFSRPMLGLEEYTHYALVRPDEKLPFAYLQAVQEPNVCLLVADPFVFRANYEFDLPEQEIQGLGEVTPEAVSVWVTVTATDSLENATMNLLAPIVINTDKRLARQIVLHDSNYETKTPLFPAKKEG
jgi:flagellar assembly factor FliW